NVDAGFETVFFHFARTAENNRFGIFDLIEIKFAEIFGIHFAFFRVGYSDKAVEGDRDVLLCAADGADNVGKLAYAGRLDENAVGRKLLRDTAERLGEIAYQSAADASGTHLRDFNAG